ncbi:MAG: hypothetical protein XU09_C0009G0032 [Thaumarchaeota archaeon CSP1-1]|nr:MAG: hypothetical protein XU09_C0009G0032 [Thaumarchaeota archaeon CSP1-1]
MDSFIVEDVNALLKLKKGDPSRLNHIKDLCEANEIVSLSDRKYIERLASQYLSKFEQKKPKSQDKPRLIPIEESISTPKTFETDASKHQTDLLKEVQITEDADSKKILSKPFDLSSNKKIILGAGAIILAIILVYTVGIAYDGTQIPYDSDTKSDTLQEFSLETDESSYETSDIISISGQISSSSSGTVRLSIENENSKVIWAENLNIKNDGNFSTLLIAGGTGWENSGKYTLNAEHEELSNQISFDFIAKK